MSGVIESLTKAAARAVATIRNAERSTGRTTRRSDRPARPVPPGVRIEYSPAMDGDPDPGEVVWAWVPYEEDPTLGKDRPVVIVGRHGSGLAAVALTSKHRNSHDRVSIGSGSWDHQGRTSYAVVDRLLEIDPSGVRREGAILARPRFDAVVAGVSRHHDVRRG